VKPRIHRQNQEKVSLSEQSRFLRMVVKYLRPYAGIIVLLLLVYAAFAVLTAIQPVILAPILDIALQGGSPPPPGQPPELQTIDLNNLGQFVLTTLGLNNLAPIEMVTILAFAYLAAATCIAALDFINYLLALKLRTAAGRDIQIDLFNHLFGLSLDFFNNERTGEIIARLDQDTRNALAGLEVALRNLIVSPLLIIYYGYLLVVTNVNLTIFVATAALLNYTLTQIMRKPIQRRMAAQVNVGAEVTAYFQEKLASARVVKTFVAERYEASQLRNLANEFVRTNMRFGILKHADEPITSVINALVNVGILLFSANELFSGRLSPVGFFLYLYIGRSILGPLTTITQSYNSIQSTMATGIRVRQLFDKSPLVVSGSTPVKEFREAIYFEQVSFGYQDSPVLYDINFEIQKGKTTALVGPSGGGKSTITDLLMRFYDPHSGKILFDGKNVQDFNLPDYRRLFGVVAQESILFNATIAENIAYARPELTKEQVEEAARIANAHEFIMELPHGYETYVGDRGVRVSGGQRQRIAIARAIAHRPRILILDEATSSLDTESEQKVQLAVDRAIQSTTAVVIAHRLSTVVGADLIVVLDQGRIIDKGKHGELMERCALYRNLALLQFNPELTVSGDR
jgi:subfamily B ATP-binding cassette protein MsbA